MRLTIPDRPVFVDPSGRRHRALRLVAIATGGVTVLYLTLVLLAVLGAPLPPAVELPLPPAVDAGAAGDIAPRSTAPSTTGQPPSTTTTAPRSASTRPPTPGAGTSSGGPAPTTTTSRRGKPTDPPGGGKPSTPPGHG